MTQEINDIPQVDQAQPEFSLPDRWVEVTISDINAAVDDTNGSDERLKISRLPKALRDVRKESYRAQLVTIGPLHGRERESFPAYRCKLLCVRRFMQRQNISDVKQLMQRLFIDISSFLDKHYSNGLDYRYRETFQLMLTLDSIFVYEFFLFLSTEQDRASPFQLLLKNEIVTNQVFRDLFLMGNQIPMTFLMKLIEEFPMKTPGALEKEKDELNRALVLVVQEVDPFQVRKSDESEDLEIPDFCSCSHLLDCLYVWVIKELPRPPPPQNPLGSRHAESHKITIYRHRLPTASQLSKAGIRFRAIEGGGISVMRYSKRSLRFDLPRLVVKDRTEDMLRNLLGHEQTSKDGVELSKYVVIMDSLIDTPEDVAILTEARVIENHLGDDEKLLEMWNGMCVTVSDRPCPTWDPMIRDVLKDYKHPCRALYVEFRDKYFSKPWLTIGLIVAFLLLLLSLVQTGYAVASYYQQEKPK